MASEQTSNQTQNNPSYKLLTKSHPPAQAEAIVSEKVIRKPLLLTPSHTTTGINHTDKRNLRRHIRLRKRQYYVQHAKPRPLSAKEKRQLNLYKLEPQEIKYDIYRGLNQLWTGYIREILGLSAPSTTSDTKDLTSKNVNVNNGSHGSLLASCDFHGMHVFVVRCVDVGRVGLEGIVVRETRSTLVLVTPDDRLITVMKKGAVFRAMVPLQDSKAGTRQDGESGGGGGGGKTNGDDKSSTNEVNAGSDSGAHAAPSRQIVFELHGSQLEFRPVERAIRKFKWKAIDYL